MAVNPIYSITPFSLLDFQDYTSCILWFAGCNMKCSYCYNPEIVNGKGVYSYQDIFTFLSKRKGLLDGVVFSGGECTLHKDLIPFIEEIKRKGFKIKIDTNGLKPEVIQEVLEKNLVDYIALDFKTLAPDFYKITKTISFDKFEQTLEILQKSEIPFEVRTTIHSDLISKENLEKMISFLEQKGYRNIYYLQPYRNNVETITELPISTIHPTIKEIKSAAFPVQWRE